MMKLTPLMIFLTMLVILVIVVALYNMWDGLSEGFVSYANDKSSLSSVLMTPYSTTNKVYKLYDNVFYDHMNGNLIEVDGQTKNAGGDSSDSSITKLTIVPRVSDMRSAQEYSRGDNGSFSVPALESSIPPSYKSFIYTTHSENTGSESDKYVVLYMPWNTDTYIHILNKTAKTHVASYVFNASNKVSYEHTSHPMSILQNGKIVETDQPVGNTLKIEDRYNTEREIFALNDKIMFDIQSGGLIVEDEVGEPNEKKNTLIAQWRGSRPIPIINDAEKATYGDDKTLTNVGTSFTPSIINNTSLNAQILYMPYGKKTLVAVIGHDIDNNIVINRVVRFLENGIDTGNPETDVRIDAPIDGQNVEGRKQSEDGKTSENGNDFFDSANTALDVIDKANKLYNKVRGDTDTNLDNYFLKTQVVPPVCPSCPACPSNGGCGCTNCGGNGGSGTMAKDGKSIVGAVGGAAKGTVGALGDIATGTVDAVGDVAEGTIDVVGDAAKGTLGLAGDVATGTLGLAGDVAKGTIGTATDILKTTGSSLASLVPNGQPGSMNGTNVAGSNAPSQKMGGNIVSNRGLQTGSTTDPYSYYGRLPTKQTGQYMPITADFSSFSK